jgi:hypothetical protein
MSYFTKIAVQNVNKGIVYTTDLTWYLSSKLEKALKNYSIELLQCLLEVLILLHTAFFKVK